jgi:hypothetical protein
MSYSETAGGPIAGTLNGVWKDGQTDTVNQWKPLSGNVGHWHTT